MRLDRLLSAELAALTYEPTPPSLDVPQRGVTDHPDVRSTQWMSVMLDILRGDASVDTIVEFINAQPSVLVDASHTLTAQAG